MISNNRNLYFMHISRKPVYIGRKFDALFAPVETAQMRVVTMISVGEKSMSDYWPTTYLPQYEDYIREDNAIGEILLSRA